jgi:hypothetical protein
MKAAFGWLFLWSFLGIKLMSNLAVTYQLMLSNPEAL